MTQCINSGKNRHGVIQCAFLCAVSAFLSFVLFIFRDQGFFHVWSDFNWQQIPFGIALHNSLSGLNIGGWTWNYDLGMSSIQAFSFYNMGTPFYWISLLFPANWYPYLVAWIYIIKYTVAGVTAYSYIRRFTAQDVSAIAGAIMYAFSGFQATNLIFYHFHDVVALFPLILTGIEQIMEDPHDKGCLIFAIFINCLTNYYFFILETVFTALYYMFRLAQKDSANRKHYFKLTIQIAGCGIWGVAIASFLFLPSILYVSHLSRAHISPTLSDLQGTAKWSLLILKGLLLPGDTMVRQSSIVEANYNSIAAYLPMAGIALSLTYCIKKRDWLSRFLWILVIISFMPLLSSTFLLFTENTQRWWFMLTLMMSLATAVVIDQEEEYPIQKGVIISLVIIAVFFLAIRILPYNTKEKSLIFRDKRVLVMTGIAMIGPAVFLLLRRIRKVRSTLMILFLCTFAIVTTGMNLWLYQSFTGDGCSIKNAKMGMQLEVIDDQYRYDVTNNQITLTGSGAGIRVFSSTIPQGVREFDSLFTFYNKTYSLDKDTVAGLPALFGAKYVLTEDAGNQVPIGAVKVDGATLYITEQAACPIGYAVNGYILRNQLMEIEKEKRGIALLNAAVIDKEDQEKVSGLCTLVTPEDIDFDEKIPNIVERNITGKVNDFTRNNQGFRCKTDYSHDKLIYFSVPNDGGWTACIDGVEQDIIGSAGMMLLVVPEGEHEIVFSYLTPGYQTGAVISLISASAFVCYWIITTVRKRKIKGK